MKAQKCRCQKVVSPGWAWGVVRVYQPLMISMRKPRCCSSVRSRRGSWRGAEDVVGGGSLRAAQGLGEVALEIYRHVGTLAYFGILSKLTLVLCSILLWYFVGLRGCSGFWGLRSPPVCPTLGGYNHVRRFRNTPSCEAQPPTTSL